MTRGERNKNPGNLRHSSSLWVGRAKVQKDSEFVTFSEPVYGIRALAKTLRTYYFSHGLNTVAKIINRWAPSHENPTNNYAIFVAKKLKVKPDTKLSLDEKTMEGLVKAIIVFENGRNVYPDAVVKDGVRRALA